MEKRTCKLCFRSFSNGRALGGHMRSHMLKLQTIASHSTTTTPPTTSITPHHHQKTLLIHQLQDETDLVSSASSSEEDDKGLSYGLRENPKKSFRLVDPEFSSFAVDACSVVQDRESETGTGSSKNPSRRRSKRNRKSGFAELPQHLLNQDHGMMMMKKVSLGKPIRAEFVIEPEPVSSVSDTSPEEDVAWCLMMLSRGIRTRKVEELVGEEDEDEYEDYEAEEAEKAVEESDEELKMIKIRVKRSRGKYQCGTCNKFFRSYQALGGHRASHKKIKGCNATTPSSSSAARPNYESDYEQEGNAGSATILPGSTNPTERRIHECPVCFRVFGSGQALGGHKRSHIPGLSSIQHPTRNAHIHINANTNTNSTRFGNNLIDLNLPAPMDDEDQIELSAVSDGDFI